MIPALLTALVLSAAQVPGARRAAFETITFRSSDGLEATADLYRVRGGKAAPFVVLFHQAGWSRGEYREIAPRLNELGLGCLAVDLRSGGGINGIANESARLASALERGTSYVDAMVDVVAALEHARAEYASGDLLAWGSSYSASLVIRAAAEHPELVDGVVAFSPGEYFKRSGKPRDWVESAAKEVRVPVFIASPRNEAEGWKAIYAALPGAKDSYLPPFGGNHGSRALWERFDDSPRYWAAVGAFLEEHFLGDDEAPPEDSRDEEPQDG